MEKKLKSVCWDITSKCNESCQFCYRNSLNKELSYEENKEILKKLIDFGVDKISFVGGEPLLYKRVIELAEWGKAYSKRKTMFSITTNAILLAEERNNDIFINEKLVIKILEVFDWITFSLDASNKQLQSQIGRNKTHFERVLKLLEFINGSNLNSKVKINTLVCKKNMGDLSSLHSLLKEYKVKRWKLFRFLASRGSAQVHNEEYAIEEDDFEEVIHKLIMFNDNKQMRITRNGYDEFDNSYVTISSEGKLVVYTGKEYIDTVNILEEDAFKILEYINVEKHLEKRADFVGL